MAARKQLFRDSLIGRLTPVPDLDLAAVCAGGGGMSYSQEKGSRTITMQVDEICQSCFYPMRLHMGQGECPPYSRSEGVNVFAATKEIKADAVNHPNHYTWHPAGVEAISIIEVFPHNIAAAMGYLWRHDHKGEPIQDLRKAIWHIEREIKRRGGE